MRDFVATLYIVYVHERGISVHYLKDALALKVDERVIHLEPRSKPGGLPTRNSHQLPWNVNQSFRYNRERHNR